MSTRIKAHQKTRSKRPPAESIPAPPPTRAPAARWSRADLAISLAVLVITAAVYAQVAHFEFTNLDDPDYVANAHVCTGFTPATIAWAFTSREAANWFPLTRLSEILDCRLFGQRSGFHHLVNLFFHLLATLFLFLFLRRATYARWPSAFVAFLFALHPLHVESVAWVAERKDVLSAFFWFLTLWAYVFYTERRTPARYVLTLVSFAFGLMSKPMLVTLPCVLLLLDFWPLGRISLTRRSTRDRKPSNARVLLEKLPFFALTIAAAMITYSSQYHGRSVIRLTTLSLGQRCANALVSYIVYIAKALWPLNFAVFYPMRPIPAWQIVLAAVALVAITLLVIRILRSHAYLAVGWFWYLGTLVPVIGFVQVGRQARADRYMYIPLVGLSIMLAWGAAELIRRRPRAKIPTAVLAAAACSFCAIQSFLQIRYWQNSGVLFEHAIAVTHENYLAETLLGAYLEQFPTRIPDALDHLEKGRAIAPPYSEAHKILAAALMNIPGHLPEVIDEYQTAIRLNPGNPELYDRLGLAFSRVPDRSPDAISQFQTFLRFEPDSAEGHEHLGNALAQAGRFPEAIDQFETALTIQPNFTDAHYSLGVALSGIPGRLSDAITQLEQGERLRPDPNLQQLLDRLRQAQTSQRLR